MNQPLSQPLNPSAPLQSDVPAASEGAAALGQRVLITGIQGFTGRYLAQSLVEAGYQVFGLVQGTPANAQELVADLLERQSIAAALEQIQPHYVVHLAAIAFVAHSDAAAMYRVNLMGTRNLLEALVPHQPRAVLLASSANIYGNTRISPITEQVAAEPANDYAVSKLAMEYMARLWFDRLPITLVRPFNYTGVGQSDNFLLPKIVSHYRRKASRIELGNLDVARDFSDVRDVVRVYQRLLECAPAGETYNICSGRAWSLFEVLGQMAHIAGYEIEVAVNPAFARANEVKCLVGSPAHLEQCIGVQQRIALPDTLRWMWQA
jgi:nucleoside-diphosphate-sugar epimerase